jgi:hypothetical protein
LELLDKLFSKDRSALAQPLKLLSAGILFPQGKIFQTANNFSCYIRALPCETEGLYPKKISAKHTARVVCACEPHIIKPKIISGNRQLESEQFFRQHERNKPQQLARKAVSDFQNAIVLKHCGENLWRTGEGVRSGRSVNRAFFETSRSLS